MTQIKKEFEEANRTHALELAEVREGWEKAKETHVREINEAISAILPAQLKVGHRMALHLDRNNRKIALNLHKKTRSNEKLG